jgi:hypothetical protein
MLRTVRRPAVAAISLLVCVLVAGASALAATPKKGARFSGHLDTPPVVGFHAPVTFRVDNSGKALDNFTFGSFGCSGAGGFRRGVNPYTGTSLIHVGTIAIASNGRFSQTNVAGYTVAGEHTTFTVTVSGRFSRRTTATGTIRFTQTTSGSPARCTSSVLGFTAHS